MLYFHLFFGGGAKGGGIWNANKKLSKSKDELELLTRSCAWSWNINVSFSPDEIVQTQGQTVHSILLYESINLKNLHVLE